MKKIYFYHGGKTYHSLFNSIVDYPPDGLRARNEISKKYSNIELIIRAKIPRDVLVKYSKLLSKPNIKIIDRIIPLNKFRSLMETSDILLFPGYITPAMTFIEAMSYEIPIIEELQCILNHPIYDHVILIDDARCFVGQNDYPTIDELIEFIYKHHQEWIVEIKNDIIRIYQPKATRVQRKQG